MEIFSLKSNNKEREFKILFETYYTPFCLYAKRFIDEQALRQDLVSDVFATLWIKRNEIELQDDTVIAYLKSCVRNSCINYLKHKDYELNYAERMQESEPIYATSPDHVYALKELYSLLHQSLNKLPQQQRDVFIKSFFDEKAHSEIAQEMNISRKSVDRYKTKVMQELTKEFKDYLPLLLILQQWSSVH